MLRWGGSLLGWIVYGGIGVSQFYADGLGNHLIAIGCMILAFLQSWIFILRIRIEQFVDGLRVVNPVRVKYIDFTEIDDVTATYNGLRIGFMDGGHITSLVCAKPNWSLFLGREVRADRVARELAECAIAARIDRPGTSAVS